MSARDWCGRTVHPIKKNMNPRCILAFLLAITFLCHLSLADICTSCSSCNSIDVQPGQSVTTTTSCVGQYVSYGSVFFWSPDGKKGDVLFADLTNYDRIRVGRQDYTTIAGLTMTSTTCIMQRSMNISESLNMDSSYLVFVCRDTSTCRFYYKWDYKCSPRTVPKPTITISFAKSTVDSGEFFQVIATLTNANAAQLYLDFYDNRNGISQLGSRTELVSGNKATFNVRLTTSAPVAMSSYIKVYGAAADSGYQEIRVNGLANNTDLTPAWIGKWKGDGKCSTDSCCCISDMTVTKLGSRAFQIDASISGVSCGGRSKLTFQQPSIDPTEVDRATLASVEGNVGVFLFDKNWYLKGSMKISTINEFCATPQMASCVNGSCIANVRSEASRSSTITVAMLCILFVITLLH